MHKTDKRGDGREDPPLSEKLLAADSCWARTVRSKNTSLVDQQLSSGGPRVLKKKSIWEAQAELNGLKKRTTEVRWIEMGW